MQLHWSILIIGVIFAFGTTFLMLPRSNKLSTRKEQSKGFFKENILAKKVDEFTKAKVRPSRMIEVETLILQAGYQMSYAELIFFSIIGTGVVGVLVAVLMNNPLLGAVVGGGVFFAPKQLLVFIRNRRVEKINEQAGSFMNMLVTRYSVLNSFPESLRLSAAEFRGQEPLYSELQKTVRDIDLGMSNEEAMRLLGVRSGNKYILRMSDYMKISQNVGSMSKRITLLKQPYEQYRENEEMKQTMKKELATVKRDAFIMLAAIPGVAIFQMAVNPDFVPFITTSMIGKVGVTAITVIFFGSIWFINNKISAPIE